MESCQHLTQSTNVQNAIILCQQVKLLSKMPRVEIFCIAQNVKANLTNFMSRLKTSQNVSHQRNRTINKKR